MSSLVMSVMGKETVGMDRMKKAVVSLGLADV